MPIGNGGKFTKEAGEIYELVLRMQKVSEGRRFYVTLLIRR